MTENDSGRLEGIDQSMLESVSALNATRAALQEWRENQTWQLNALRKRLDSGLTAANTLLAMIFCALSYIAYKLG